MSARAPISMRWAAAVGRQPRRDTLSRHLWLWDKVRVQGGAYGGRCSFDHHSGGFTYLSYRDPNLMATLDVYDRTAEFLTALTLDETEVTRTIIGTIGDLDFYRLPDAKGYSSMQRYLIGDTDAAASACATRFSHDEGRLPSLRRCPGAGGGQRPRDRARLEQAMAAANAERPGLLTVKRVM